MYIPVRPERIYSTPYYCFQTDLKIYKSFDFQEEHKELETRTTKKYTVSLSTCIIPFLKRSLQYGFDEKK